MLGRSSLFARNVITNFVRNHGHGGIPGENLPFDIHNRFKLTAMFIVFFGSGFGAPFLILRHQLLKNIELIWTMASQTQGIQQLLTAEKRAAEKVAEARKRKARRIKQAREEAQAEIENYRRERERQFREYEAKYMGSREDVAVKIDKNTEQMLIDVETDVKNNKEKVLADLLYLILDVKPAVHPNYKIMKIFGKI